MGRLDNMDIRSKVCMSLFVKFAEWALLIVVSTTMSNINGKVIIAFLNVFIAIPQLFVLFFLVRYLRRDNSSTRSTLACSSFLSILTAFFTFI